MHNQTWLSTQITDMIGSNISMMSCSSWIEVAGEISRGAALWVYCSTCWTCHKWSVELASLQYLLYLARAFNFSIATPFTIMVWLMGKDPDIVSSDSQARSTRASLMSMQASVSVGASSSMWDVKSVPSLRLPAVKFSRLSSISSLSRGAVIRKMPKGEKIEDLGLLLSKWSMSEVKVHSSSTIWQLCLHAVWRGTFFTLTFPFQAAGLIWLALYGISFESHVIAGSFSCQGEQSHSGYFARMFATSVMLPRREMGCVYPYLNHSQP